VPGHVERGSAEDFAPVLEMVEEDLPEDQGTESLPTLPVIEEI
jgi:hypothetical protein